MALHDSNPERRNLSVMSLSIIVFFLAGGEFTESTVRLQIINVYFSNSEVLSDFIWILLVWFLFRYWLIHQGSWKKEFASELNFVPTRIIYWHLTKRFELDDDFSRSYYPNRHFLKIDGNSGTKLTFRHIYKNETDSQLSDTIQVSTIGDRALVGLCAVYLFFRKPSLSGYFIPYFLFLWAVSLGVLNVS